MHIFLLPSIVMKSTGFHVEIEQQFELGKIWPSSRFGSLFPCFCLMTNKKIFCFQLGNVPFFNVKKLWFACQHCKISPFLHQISSFCSTTIARNQPLLVHLRFSQVLILKERPSLTFYFLSTSSPLNEIATREHSI